MKPIPALAALGAALAVLAIPGPAAADGPARSGFVRTGNGWHGAGRGGAHGGWHGGHHWHGGRYWWFAAPLVVAPWVWGAPAYAAPPVYSAPPAYMEPPVAPVYEAAPAYRYYCAESHAYYPEVAQCPSPWLRVLPN